MQTTEITPEQIEATQLYKQMGLSDEEYDRVKMILKRRPNRIETGIFAVMWSEHCSYKTSEVLLKQFPVEGRHVLQGPGEGAGVIDIGDEQAVVFKVESHNHPSAVDPYAGAATGAGGILRDIFSMGARPFALLSSLWFGRLQDEHVKNLFQGVVQGISDYGKGTLVPTIDEKIQFDSGYAENPLVNAMCVGLVDHKDIQSGIASGVGNTVIYAGAATGRDGIHGATSASGNMTEDSEKSSSVPTGNPLIEKALMDACLEVITSDALIGMQDMGAAGFTSSASEMTSKAETGIELNLDLVPQRDKNMSAYELMLSESQERMLLVVKQGREKEIMDIFATYDVHAAEVGEVMGEKMFRLLHHGTTVADIPVDALVDEAPVYEMPSREPAYFQEFQQMRNDVPVITDHGLMLKKLLELPSIASNQGVYDSHEPAEETDILLWAESEAGVIRINGTNKALAATTDCNSRYMYLDPETGGKIAVAKAARNIVCTGATPLGMTDGLNFGNPANPEVYWQMEQSVHGISEACRLLKTPVVSGNVSLYNESNEKAVPPTPVVGMVGLTRSLEHVTSSHFRQPGDAVYLIGAAKDEFGGSKLQFVLFDGEVFGTAPSIDLKLEADRQAQLLDAIHDGIIQSARGLSEGGLAVALAESCFTEQSLGVTVDLEGDRTVEMFSESQSRFLVSVQQGQEARFQKLVGDAKRIGTVTADATYTVREDDEKFVEEPVAVLSAYWKGALPCLLNKKA